MKITFVVIGPLDERSGGFLYDRRFADFLIKNGDELMVVSLPELSYKASSKPGVRRDALRKILASQGDIIVEDELCHSYLSGIEKLPGAAELPQRIALVHHLRSDEKHSVLRRVLEHSRRERRYLSNVQGFIWNGSDTRLSVLRAIKKREVPGVVARPWVGSEGPVILPVDSEIREPLSRVIFVGNIMRRKNLHIVLRALRALGDNAPRLTVIGAEEFEPEYAAYCKKLAADLPVAFLGRVGAGELPEHYRRNQLLVLPSSHEGYGIVYLEAMRQGLAVIGSNTGGAPEAIGKGGLLIRPGNVKLLAAAIAELRESPETLSALRKAAIQQAATHPRWDESFTAARAFLAERVRSARDSCDPLN